MVVEDIRPQLAVSELSREPHATMAGADERIRRFLQTRAGGGPCRDWPVRRICAQWKDSTLRASVAQLEQAQRARRERVRPIVSEFCYNDEQG